MSKIKTFYVPDHDLGLLEKLEDLKWRERKSEAEIIITALKEYLEKHIDGNPTFTLEQFQDPNFKACPSFFRSIEVWKKYLESLPDKTFSEFETQLNQLVQTSNAEFKKRQR